MLETIKLKSFSKYVAVAKYLTGFSEIRAADDEFTAAFEEYVKNWQRINDLNADGIIGEKGWTAIAVSAPTCSQKRNRKSAATCALQLLLGVEADGIFGNKTKAAVVAFQAASDLTADGICGPKTWGMLVVGKTADENIVPSGPVGIQPPNFKQGDSRWGKKMYSNHNDPKQTMASSACGPTSMADIVAQWWNSSITPYDLAKLSVSWGTRTYDSGTSPTFFRRIADKYHASKYIISKSIDVVIQCLEAGGYVIVCFGPGTKGKAGYQKWTKGGHYCCIWKWDGKYFYINDPASSSSARAKGTREEVQNTRKGFYLFWK
jgi:hypothetical protein